MQSKKPVLIIIAIAILISGYLVYTKRSMPALSNEAAGNLFFNLRLQSIEECMKGSLINPSRFEAIMADSGASLTVDEQTLMSDCLAHTNE